MINPPTKQRSDEEHEEGETEVAADGNVGPRTNDVGILCDEPSTHLPATVVCSSILHDVRPGCSVDDPLVLKANALENSSIAPSTKKEESGDIITFTSDNEADNTPSSPLCGAPKNTSIAPSTKKVVITIGTDSDESLIDSLIQKLNSMSTSKITMMEVREKYNEICCEKPQYTRHIDKSNPPSNAEVIVEDINILRDENMRTNKDDMSRSGSCSSGEWSRKLGLGSNTSSTCAGDPYLTTFHLSTTKEGQIHPNHPHTYLINNSFRDHTIHVQGNDSLSTFSFTSEGGQASEQLAATVVSGLHLTAAASSEPSMDAAPSTTQISAWERKTKGVVGGGESPEKMNAPSTMTEPGAAEESSKMSSAVVTAPEATLVAASLEALAAGAKGTSRVMAPSLAVQEVAATPTMTVMTTTTSTGMAMVMTTTTGRVMIPSMTNEGPATHFCAESNMDGYQMWNSSSA